MRPVMICVDGAFTDLTDTALAAGRDDLRELGR